MCILVLYRMNSCNYVDLIPHMFECYHEKEQSKIQIYFIKYMMKNS